MPHAIFPTPQQITSLGATIVQPCGAARLPAGPAGDLLRRVLGDRPAADFPIAIGLADEPAMAGLPVPPQPEGYTLRADAAGVVIAGRDPAGCFYGAQTLAQLLRVQGEEIAYPAVEIRDWPDFRHRGIYVEDFWGSDLMGVEDYRALIDRCAGLKLNTLIIGLFGGWEIKHHGKITEFLMIPLRRHPELQTPQLLRYFDPATRQWVERRYLPRMAAEDSLNDVIRLAAAQHIRVAPLWGGPAHVTLLPRLYPAISAKDAAGRPVGYGYCVSEPATWALLGDILDEIVERYLRPNGLDMLQLACDEIYPIRSVYEDAPLAEVNPWCQCPDCASLGQAGQLTRYVVTLAGFLKQRGVKTMIWQDTFERLDAMPTLWAGLQAAGLQDDITMGWWCYKEPLPDFSKRLPIPNWTQPSVGILASIFHQDLSRNIYGMLRRGWEAGAVGATAYNVPDPAQHKDYHCLAEFAWRQADAGGIAHFEIKYAQTYFGPAWRDALEAYDAAQRITGSYPLLVYILDQLLYYFNSYPYGTRDYPANILTDLAGDPLALQTALKQSIAHLETARSLAERCRPHDRAGLLPDFFLECDRIISVARAALGTVDALGAYAEARRLWPAERPAAQARLAESAGRLRAISEEVLRVMAEIARLKPAYLVPATLREVSYLASFLHDLAGETARIEAEARAGRLAEPPLLPIVEKIGERRLRALWHPWEF